MPQSIRIYQQSAVIPFLVNENDVQVVLITSLSSGTWIIPKGLIEAGMTPEASAAKEAFEEAGLRGEVSSEVIATYTYSKWGGTCHVRVYPLEVTDLLDTWQEAGRRDRALLSIEDALAQVRQEMKPAMRAFAEWHQERS